MTQLDQENVWQIVRKIRKSFLSQHKDLTCQKGYKNTLSDNHIKDNVNTLGEKIKQNATLNTNRNVSDETLFFAANLFTFLSYCPTKNFNFVKYLVESESVKNILMALTNMIKTSQNADKKSSTRIFKKAMEVFDLNMYKNIDAITREKGFDDSKQFNEILQVLGK